MEIEKRQYLYNKILLKYVVWGKFGWGGEMYLHTLKIGNVELKNNILLAPMAGITDLPFRKIVEKFEPGLVTTEMVS